MQQSSEVRELQASHTDKPRREGAEEVRPKVVAELNSTNWILRRWAVSVGDGLYDAPWDDVPKDQVSPLGDQMAIVVDQLVMRSPKETQRLIGYWYRTSLPKTVIAQKIGLDKDTIYVAWNAALWYFRDRFVSSPLSELRFIASTDIDTGRKQPVAKVSVLEHKDQAKCGYCLSRVRTG